MDAIHLTLALLGLVVVAWLLFRPRRDRLLIPDTRAQRPDTIEWHPPATTRPRGPRRTVVFTFVDSTSGPPNSPLVLTQLADLPVDRVVLLHTPELRDHTEQLRNELMSADRDVLPLPVPIEDTFDFDQVSRHLQELAATYPFDEEREAYFLHVNGAASSMVQTVLVFLAKSAQLPAQLLWTATGRDDRIVHRVAVADLGPLARDRPQQVGEVQTFDSLNPKYRAMRARIEDRGGRYKLPIVLLGETGTGKSELAKLLYRRKVELQGIKGPFVHGNCSAVKGDIARSQLFGHKRGAFTGAVEDHVGWLVQADGGVLFLDEIGLLGLAEQELLLLVLDHGEVTPIGSTKKVATRFQLIAATNLDLDAEVRAGRFRADLRARLGPSVFELPPLRERREDLPGLLAVGLARASKAIERPVRMTREAESLFLSFACSEAALWSTNLRAYFDSIVDMAMDTSATGSITVEIVERQIASLRPSSTQAGDAEPRLVVPARFAHLDYIDQYTLAEVLRVCRRCETASEAGRMLFDKSRLKRVRLFNDGDRLTKYLLKYELTFAMVKAGID